MFRKFAAIVALFGLVGFVACSDDNGNPRIDTGADVIVVPDIGDYDLPQGDTMPAADLDCMGLLECTLPCGENQTCITDCINRGTQAAVTDFQAWISCLQGSMQGTCATDCADPNSQACNDCLETDCATEYDTCAPPITGFGDTCDETNTCPDGLTCLFSGEEATVGFCTRTCEGSGYPCYGNPTGTNAACIIPTTGGDTVCGFVCKYDDGVTDPIPEWACPNEGTGMECGTDPNPDCGGTPPCQYTCEVIE